MKNGWEEHYEAGKRAFEEHDYSAARQALEKVVKVKDNFADIFNMLGICYYNDGFRNEAIKAFKKALELNPGYTEASLNLSVVYNERGDFDKAHDTYSKAKKSEQSSPETYLDPYVKGKVANMHAELGTVYKYLYLYQDAVREYRKALALRPGFVDIKTNLGIVYRTMKEYGKSVRELEDVIGLKPEYTPARVQLGLTYYLMGKHEKARAEWLEALRTDPEDKLTRMYINLIPDTSG
jgi:tetratricopeptide (TPR) repeat protein